MKRLNEILLALLIAWLIVLLIFLFLWARKEAPLVHNTLWNVSLASAKANTAADKEIEHFTNELQETQKATAAAKTFFDHTDLSVNGRRQDGLIPQMTTLVRKAQPVADNLASAAGHLDQAILHTDTAIQSLNALLQSGTATMAEVQASLKRVNDLIVALEGQVSDPSIRLALDNLAAAGKAMADGMQQLAAASTDVRQIADKARETYLKPVNLWWGLVKELLPLAGSAAQVVK